MELDVKADATDLFNVRGEKTYGPSSNYYARLQNLYVDSNVLVDGGVTVNGAFDASQLDIGDIFAQDVTVGGTLTIGSSGQIKFGSSPTDWSLDDSGLVFAEGDVNSRAIEWEDSGGGFVARIWTDKDGGGTRTLHLTNTDIIDFNPSDRLRFGATKFGLQYEPTEEGLIFHARSADPTSSEIDSILEDGQAFVYLVHEGGFQSDVRLKYYEKKGDGTLQGPKKIKD